MEVEITAFHKKLLSVGEAFVRGDDGAFSQLSFKLLY